jgi:hypothetical protein
MSQRSNNLTQFTVALLIALLTLGCQAPWTTAPSFTRIGSAGHGGAGDDSALKAATSLPPVSVDAEPRASIPAGPKTGDTDQPMADVMQEVDRLGATNPAAQKLLLDELQRSKPEMWPLVVQHFKSTASYHEQLAAKQTVTTPARDGAPDRMSHALGSNAQVTTASPGGSSSARIGELTDPRGAQSDSPMEHSLAVATPANMPAPFDPDALANVPKASQPLATDPAARPIVAANSTAPSAASSVPSASTVSAAGDAPHRATQAIYDTSADGSGGVKHSLATATVGKANNSGGPTTESSANDASRDWRQDVDQAIKDLEQHLPDAPQTTAEVHQQVSLRLLELLAGRTEDALKPIPQISHEEQDYWSGQIFALATYLDHHSQPDDKRRAAASVAHLEDAVGHLRELGSLSLRNLTFCKHVYDFGAYDPYDDAQFAAGQQVTLYVEVENYHSDSTDKGYCTSLGTSYEVFDEQGKRVEGGDFPDVEDCCRSHRRDFHIQYGMAIPKKLSPGKYRLDLVMKDRRGDKLGHASIDFEIRAKS